MESLTNLHSIISIELSNMLYDKNFCLFQCPLQSYINVLIRCNRFSETKTVICTEVHILNIFPATAMIL